MPITETVLIKAAGSGLMRTIGFPLKEAYNVTDVTTLRLMNSGTPLAATFTVGARWRGLPSDTSKALKWVQDWFTDKIISLFTGGKLNLEKVNAMAKGVQQQTGEDSNKSKQSEGDAGKAGDKQKANEQKAEEEMTEAQKLHEECKKNVASADELLTTIDEVEQLVQKEIAQGEQWLAELKASKEKEKQELAAKEAQKQIYADPEFRKAFREDARKPSISHCNWDYYVVQEVHNPKLKPLFRKTVAEIAREQFAIRIAVDDFEHRAVRQRFGGRERALADAAKLSVVFQLFQDMAQLRSLFAADFQHARQIALAARAANLAQRLKHDLAREARSGRRRALSHASFFLDHRLLHGLRRGGFGLIFLCFNHVQTSSAKRRWKI